MKTIHAFILFLLFSLNNDTNYSIIGVQKNCKNNQYDSRERYLQLYKEDKLIEDGIKTRFGEFKIKNLEKGNYTLRYINIFGQVCNKEIAVNQKSTSIEICTNDFIDTKGITLFESLKEIDTLFLTYKSQGCFHSEKEELKFYKQKENLIGEIQVKTKKRIKKLDSDKIEFLVMFEKKVRAIKDGMGGCTTADDYVFQLIIKKYCRLRMILVIGKAIRK